MNDDLDRAISALRAGDRAEARRLLAAVLRQDKDNLRAWQWMYNAADNDKERKHCLEQILRLNPGNQKAAQMLAQLSGSSVAPKKEEVSTPEKSPAKNKNLLIGIGATSLLLVACCCAILTWSFFDQSQTTNNYIAEYGGSQAVYDRIASLDDCAQLQAEFDLASQNNSLQEPGSQNALATTGYMVAINDRMEKLGCYEQKPLQQPEALLASNTIDLPENTPTAQVSLTAIPQPTNRSILRATFTTAPTLTPLPNFTAIVQAPVSGAAVCSCSADTYNCTTDFQTQASAQACFDYCLAQGAGDIHRLDGNDNDGRACETLP